MATKTQHRLRYRALPAFLRDMREAAGLTQRNLGSTLKKPQSWVYNCEQGIRRVDVVEFVDWATACGVSPRTAFWRLLKNIGK